MEQVISAIAELNAAMQELREGQKKALRNIAIVQASVDILAQGINCSPIEVPIRSATYFEEVGERVSQRGDESRKIKTFLKQTIKRGDISWMDNLFDPEFLLDCNLNQVKDSICLMENEFFIQAYQLSDVNKHAIVHKLKQIKDRTKKNIAKREGNRRVRSAGDRRSGNYRQNSAEGDEENTSPGHVARNHRIRQDSSGTQQPRSQGSETVTLVSSIPQVRASSIPQVHDRPNISNDGVGDFDQSTSSALQYNQDPDPVTGPYIVYTQASHAAQIGNIIDMHLQPQ